MIVEVISIGEELLAGKVVDTNSSFLAAEVKTMGFQCRYKTTVGDNVADIHSAIDKAISRANIILITGGLGPTDDDLTISAIASFFKEELIFWDSIAAKIKEIFSKRNISMAESNLKQAYLPKGSIELVNPIGTAPGMFWDITTKLNSKEPKLILTFPGVPYEMELIWKESAKSFLSKYSNNNIYERYINLTGVSESGLVEKVQKYMNRNDPYVLPYVNNFMVQLRVYAENNNLDIAKEMVDNTVAKIYDLTEEYIFGFDDDTLESVTGSYLRENNLTISLAESCTGGLISSRLTDVAGSSDYIKFNSVSYSNESKIKILGVSEETINKYGAVSKETVKQMADGIRILAGTDIGMAISGIAGPTGGNEDKPVGTAFIAISNGNLRFVKHISVGSAFPRNIIKYRFSQYALNCLRIFLQSNYKQQQEKKLQIKK